MSEATYRRLLRAAQRAILADERLPAPQRRLGLPPPCTSWLGGGVVLAYCGTDAVGSSMEPGIRGAPQLQVSSDTMHGGAEGAIAQFMGLPLRVGDRVRLRALSATSGYLAVLTRAASGAQAWARFDVHLRAGADGALTNPPTAGPRLQVGATAEPPARSVAVPDVSSALLPPSPDSSGPYQDCRAVGPITKVSDPVGDTAVPGMTTRVPGSGSTDVTDAVLAVRGQLICLDVTTARPPAPGDGFTLGLYGPGAGRGRLNRVIVALASGRRVIGTSASATPNDLPDGPAAGLVGVRGDSISLMIDQRQFAPEYRTTRFGWQVQSSGTDPSPSDCVPDAAAAPAPGVSAGAAPGVPGKCA